MKRSALEKALKAAGVDQATADSMVKAMLASGECVDDLSVDDDTLGRHMDALQGAMAKGGDGGVDEPDALLPEGADELPWFEVVDVISKGAESIVQNVHQQHQVLAEATIGMLKAQVAIGKNLEAVVTRLEAMEKAFGKLDTVLDSPVPPRAADVDPVQHPGDRQNNGGGEVSREIALNTLSKAMRDAPEGSGERSVYKSAIAACETYLSDPAAILKSVGLA